VIDVKKIAWFLLLTFAVSWSIAGIFFALGGKVTSPLAGVVFLLYMFVPMAMALVVQKGIYRQPVVGPLGISFRLNKWFPAAWFLPLLFSLAAFGISLLLPGVTYAPLLATLQQRLTPEQIAQIQPVLSKIPDLLTMLIMLFAGLSAGITVNAIAAFGEELGWRGLLQRELAPLGFWGSSLLIGAIWGLWHAPIIWHGYNYPQHPHLGVVMMMLFCMLFGTVISYVRLRAKSVIAAAIMHGTLNGVAGLTVLYTSGGSDLTTGALGLAGFLVLIALNILIILYERFIAKEPVMAEFLGDQVAAPAEG